jgi:hypothetical protein
MFGPLILYWRTVALVKALTRNRERRAEDALKPLMHVVEITDVRAPVRSVREHHIKNDTRCALGESEIEVVHLLDRRCETTYVGEDVELIRRINERALLPRVFGEQALHE